MLLGGDAVAVQVEDDQALGDEAADEQGALPFGNGVGGIEGHAGRGDDRIPIVDGLLHPLLRRNSLADGLAAVGEAVGDDRPAVVLAGFRAIQLVAALRTVLDDPEPSLRVHHGGLHVAVAVGPDRRLRRVGEGIAVRDRAVLVDPEHLAEAGRQVLRLVADRRVRALADGHEEAALRVEGETRAEMLVAVIGGGLAEDHPHVLQGARVALDGEARPRHAGAVAAAVARLGVGEEDRAALGEVWRQRHVEKAALAVRVDLRHALDGVAGRAVAIDDVHVALLRRNQHPPVRQELHRPEPRQVVGDGLHRDLGRLRRLRCPRLSLEGRLLASGVGRPHVDGRAAAGLGRLGEGRRRRQYRRHEQGKNELSHGKSPGD